MPLVLDTSVTMSWAFGEIDLYAAHIRELLAAYLELAMRDGVPLATTDDALRAAAARVGVPLVAGP